MTDQELFDKVARHLLTQGRKSVDGNGSLCRYRGCGGLKCAIGVLIPDELYSPELEGNPAWSTAVCRAAGLYEGVRHLAQCLQDVHDEREPDEWRRGLLCVAETFGLSPNAVLEVTP